MTTKQIHTDVRFLINKGQGGYYSPDQIDSAWNKASLDKYNEEKMRFEVSNVISDNLRNFKKFQSITTTNGFGDLPEDYDLRTNCLVDGKRAEFITEGEYADKINDILAPPTSDYPIVVIRDQIEVVPDGDVVLYYLKKPAEIKYGFTVVDNKYIYDDATTINPDWPDSCYNDILIRSLTYLGLNLQEGILMQFKAMKKQTENV